MPRGRLDAPTGGARGSPEAAPPSERCRDDTYKSGHEGRTGRATREATRVSRRADLVASALSPIRSRRTLRSPRAVLWQCVRQRRRRRSSGRSPTRSSAAGPADDERDRAAPRSATPPPGRSRYFGEEGGRPARAVAFQTSMCLLTCTVAANGTSLRRCPRKRPVRAVLRPFRAQQVHGPQRRDACRARKGGHDVDGLRGLEPLRSP